MGTVPGQHDLILRHCLYQLYLRKHSFLWHMCQKRCVRVYIVSGTGTGIQISLCCQLFICSLHSDNADLQMRRKRSPGRQFFIRLKSAACDLFPNCCADLLIQRFRSVRIQQNRQHTFLLRPDSECAQFDPQSFPFPHPLLYGIPLSPVQH